ncbi:SDR family NAD(P)-dependent oxidoreductase [Bdellovibrionota bacterium FG-2]
MKALITGASSGLGESYSKILASYGWDLVLVARRGFHLLRLSEALKKEYGIKVETFACDLLLEADREKVKNYLAETVSLPELLINNAGTGTYHWFPLANLSDHLNVIRLNIEAPVALTHHWVNEIKKRKQNEHFLLNVSSLAALQNVPKYAVYSASKTFLLEWSETLDHEFRALALPIFVSCLCPGGIDTDFFKSSGQNIGVHSVMMTPEEVARYSLKKVFQRKFLIIPGKMNRLTRWLGHWVPMRLRRTLTRSLMGYVTQDTVQ